MLMSSTKCVIFDCDGTLIDSERLCCQALVNVLRRYGAQMSYQECIDHFKGGKLADILSEAIEYSGVNVSIDLLEPQYREELHMLFIRYLKPMDGVERLIHFLDEYDIHYCVASNGPRDKVEHSLKLTGLFDVFAGKVFSAFDTNSWKPDPDLLMYSAMNMGFLPDECLYIDDTPKGIEAGLNAGITTIQLYNGAAANLVDDNRVIRVQHLDEVRELIREEKEQPHS
ncbi:HAD-IA family hydrolase [Vibrio sagamiensis]|uniref:Haloacid dehalogenase n=1 Tax=Vibrio sagamiensis NBRC 104589 TaxID=1219064 RepID=A0A511QG60_9VIBR|nr:HAD-IA family hydrolase [Vibrio sagamiensis]PNQ54358.1 HAD family hydrolase [Vibrio agarivorans]GEM76136.1 haloacid dehalogenase [Vibrio sagamiensis NBRC 104589]